MGTDPGDPAIRQWQKAERFISRYGLKHVVDMGLSKCFDRLDHDLIIESVNRKVSDGSVLKLIRKFLEAGVMKDGAGEKTTLGSPQADSAQSWDEC